MLASLKYICVILSLVSYVLASDEYNASAKNNNTLSFDRVLIVVLENQPLSASLRNPYMWDIISKGTTLTNYYGLVNPSQPNYIGLTAGDLMGVKGDDNYDIEGLNIVDLMEAKNISWKSYQENYPGDCFAEDIPSKLYKRKHNPFISFNNVRNDPARCAKIVDANELATDLAQGTVPQYSFYTPNMNNNGHDTGLDYAAKWLTHEFLPTYLKPFNATGRALLVITFDEGIPGNNKIYTLLIGDMIPAASIDNTRYDHYSLLRSIEDNFALGNLGRHDAKAQPITKAHFVKGVPTLGSNVLMLALIVSFSIIGVFGIVAAIFMVKRRQIRRRREREMSSGLFDSFAEENESV